MILRTVIKSKKVVFITGDKRVQVAEFAIRLLKDEFSIYYLKRVPTWRDILALMRCSIIIVEDDASIKAREIKGLLKSCSGSLILTLASKKGRVKGILKSTPSNWDMILDLSIAKKIKRERGRKVLTFAIDKSSADFYITDIHKANERVNFKINYKGNIIPFWIEKPFTRDDIYAVLPALCLAKMMDLNLATVSCKIREDFSVDK